jgi:hypothetical protein
LKNFHQPQSNAIVGLAVAEAHLEKYYHLEVDRIEHRPVVNLERVEYLHGNNNHIVQVTLVIYREMVFVHTVAPKIRLRNAIDECEPFEVVDTLVLTRQLLKLEVSHTLAQHGHLRWFFFFTFLNSLVREGSLLRI